MGYGKSGSATTDKDKDANERFMHLVEQTATSFHDVNRFEIPCDDPYGVKAELQRQIKNAINMNVLIAPMNNKLTTIGSALAALENDDVQMCYAQALAYNYTDYSTPGDACYIFDLPEVFCKNAMC
ncbi:MAG: hypothetical protein WC076_05110 [Terrimicrobiaceae bacterium]